MRFIYRHQMLLIALSVFSISLSAEAGNKKKKKKNWCGDLAWLDKVKREPETRKVLPKPEPAIDEAQAKRIEVSKRLREDFAVLMKSRDAMAREIANNLQAVAVKAKGADGYAAVVIGELPRGKALQKLDLLISSLLGKGFHIVFDADAPSAKFISNKIGNKGFGISGSVDKAAMGETPVLGISNEYQRMEAFGRMQNQLVIADHSSVLGVGLRIEGHASAIFAGSTSWRDGFESWTQDIDGGLGVKTIGVSEVRIDGIVQARPRSANAAAIQKPLAPEIWSDQVLRDAINLASEMEAGRAKVVNESIAGGAVIFGSSSNDPRWSQKVYDSGFTLSKMGVPVSTGGSGGYMEQANRGAFAGGAASIGIPIGMRALERAFDTRLAAEGEVPRGFQTVTFSASGYPTRIPLLLHQKRVIDFVPGGSGTMRELATVLVKMAAEPNFELRIVFTDKGYYQGLHQWLQSLPLTPSVKARIKLVDSGLELEREVTDLGKTLGPEANGLFSAAAPKERELEETEGLK